MRIDFTYFQESYQRIQTAFKETQQSLFRKTNDIKNRVLEAYSEPSKPASKLVLQQHPLAKTHQKKNWTLYKNSEVFLAQEEIAERVTLLHVSVLENKKDIFYQCIAEGSNVNARDIRGQTPAYWAAYHGNLDMLMKLKKYGADLTHRDLRGKTPLRAAAKYNHVHVIEFLASHKVDLNELDDRGLSPLHLAAYHANIAAYEALICSGADQTIKDPLGRTAEEILKMKYAELYHNKNFIGRLMTSKEPPQLSVKPGDIKYLLTNIAAGNQ